MKAITIGGGTDRSLETLTRQGSCRELTFFAGKALEKTRLKKEKISS
jgi:hypothetical protein